MRFRDLGPVFAYLPLLMMLFPEARAHTGEQNDTAANSSAKGGRAYGPDFYKGILDPATLALAANHFIRMGEKRTVEALLEETRTDPYVRPSIAYRRRLLLNVLFESSDPDFDASHLGASMLLPNPKTPAEKRALNQIWPQLPIVESQGVYFLVDDLFVVMGLPEPFANALQRCQDQAHFRTKELKVPNRSEAQAAFDALAKRPEWRKLIDKSPASLEGRLRDEIAATPE